jgi:hypothetical protein
MQALVNETAGARSSCTMSTGRLLAAFSVYIYIYIQIARACFIPFANLVPGEVIEKCGNEIHHVIPLLHLRTVTLSFLRPHFH